MCRNIRTLYNFEPPATHEEVRGGLLQFVRKISGFAEPRPLTGRPSIALSTRLRSVVGVARRARHVLAAQEP